MPARSRSAPEEEPAPFPDPRHHETLIGQEAAQAEFLEAVRGGRLHHGWLLCGPRGVGKATLGFRMARFLLRHGGRTAEGAPPSEMGIGSRHPVFRQVAALSHPDFMLLEPGRDEKTGRRRTVLTVDEARRARALFTHSAAQDGFRICMIDSVDDMNLQAANAILKILEEPPPASLFILIAHRPGLILPTIRSRCRALRLPPVSLEQTREVVLRHMPGLSAEEAEACAALAPGQPGRALAIAASGAQTLPARIDEMLRALPKSSPAAFIEFSQSLGRREAQDSWELFMGFVLDWITREAQAASGVFTAAGLLRLWDAVDRIRLDAPRLNLDRAAAVLNVLLLFEEEARAA